MKGRSDYSGCMSEGSATTTSSTSKDEEIEWEMRPGGMLVQKRTEKSDSLAPNLLIRVAYGALRYEISVNSQATFGMIDRSVSFLCVIFSVWLPRKWRRGNENAEWHSPLWFLKTEDSHDTSTWEALHVFFSCVFLFYWFFFSSLKIYVLFFCYFLFPRVLGKQTR